MDDGSSTERSSPFRAMAERIDLNRDQAFGGAFVIMAPDGTCHEMLLLDGGQFPAVFWSLVQTRAQIVLQQAEENERRGMTGFGRG